MTLQKLLIVKKYILQTLLVFGLLLALFTPQISFADGWDILIDPLIYLFWVFVNTIFGTLVYLGGLFLDHSITHFVVGFGFYYKEYGIGSAIDLLWTSVRDIFNLTFIFGLVYIGFKMILDSSDSGAKKALGSLILAALLVNFSLFITKTVIDFSNIAATQFVQTYESPKGSNEYNVAERLMTLLGINTIFGLNDYGEKTFGYVIGAMFLYLVTAFVFLSGAILLLIRFLSLNIYMLLSPAMFIGWIFPGFSGVTKKYWEGFLGQAFFAPAYFLMLHFSLKIVEKLKDGLIIASGPDTKANLAATFSTKNWDVVSGSFNSVFMFFLVASGFMIASLIVAKKMGAVGATTAVSLGQRGSNMIRGSVTSFAGRNTIGRLAEGAEWANNKLEQTRTGRNFKRVLSVASLGAFDERSRRAAIEAGKKAKFGGNYSRQDDKNWGTTRAQGQHVLQSEHTRNEKIKTGQAGAADLAALRTKKKTTGLTPAEETRLATLEQAEIAMHSVITSMSGNELEKIAGDDPKKLEEEIAPHLTASQVENIMKNDKIDPATKEKITKARQAAIEKVIGTGSSVITEELTKLSLDQIETMGDDWIRENAHLFTDTQMEGIKNSKKYGVSQRNGFVAQREGWHKAAMTPGGPVAFNGKATDPTMMFKHSISGKRRKPIDVANLGRDVLMKMDAAFLLANPNLLTTDALEMISEKKTLGATDRATLRQNIEDAYTASGYAPGPLRELNDYFSSPRVVANGF